MAGVDRLLHFADEFDSKNLSLSFPMKHTSLSTMQRNALCQWFGRRDFTPEEVAEIEYGVMTQLPKVGSKGIDLIRSWLQQYGYDLKNIPVEGLEPVSPRLHQRLQNAERLLVKHGYRVEPPP